MNQQDLSLIKTLYIILVAIFFSLLYGWKVVEIFVSEDEEEFRRKDRKARIPR